MTIPSPQISVVTPIYERPDQVSAILTTLRAQSFDDWELVLVDDASSADIAAQVPGDDPRVRFKRLPQNMGPAGARNHGIDLAHGRFVAFLDSDDIWEQDKLARQHAAICALADPDRSFCVCQTQVVYPGGQVDVLPKRGPQIGERGASYLYSRNQFAQCSSFLAGAALLHGPQPVRFDETLRQYEDHLFFIAAMAQADANAFVAQPLSIWHNDARADRMGARDDLARGQQFMDKAMAAGLMEESEAIAFELRCLGPEIARKSRFAAMRLAQRGMRAQGVPRDAWMKLLLAGVIGPERYARLREAFR